MIYSVLDLYIHSPGFLLMLFTATGACLFENFSLNIYVTDSEWEGNRKTDNTKGTTNQPNNTPNNQLANQTTRQTNQPTNRPTKQPANQTNNKSNYQPNNQTATKKPANQTTS